MESARTQINVIFCPDHPSEFILKVDPKPDAQKHTYCFNCVMESNDPKALSPNLISIQEFIKRIDSSYSKLRKTIKVTDPPVEFMTLISEQSVSLEKMVNHVSEQKKKVEKFFEELSQNILETINQHKLAYIKTLDEQVAIRCKKYQNFEDELKAAYVSQEDLNSMFPSMEELERRLSKIDNCSGLNDFVNEAKQNTMSVQISTQSEEEKKLYFERISNDLKKIENNLPSLKAKNFDMGTLKSDMKKFLDKVLEGVFELKNQIVLGLKNTDSVILKADDLLTIKEWLPIEYRNKFDPKLLYRGSSDGMTPLDFHSRCDNKGPTITVIKCIFNGSNQSRVIGGYLDANWNQSGDYIKSKNAFIFSLSQRVKCPVSQSKYAAQGLPGWGPVFGARDIAINWKLSDSEVHPYFYTNTVQLIPFSNFREDQIHFMPQDIEVFKLF